MKRFAQAVKDLQINKLTEKIGIGYPPETNGTLANTYEDINHDNKELIQNEFAGRSILDMADEIINLDIPSVKLGFSKEVYKCEECETMLFLYILQL